MLETIHDVDGSCVLPCIMISITIAYTADHKGLSSKLGHSSIILQQAVPHLLLCLVEPGLQFLHLLHLLCLCIS